LSEYRGSYSIPFDVDESILADLKNELEVNGIPSISKIGVGLTFARSLPYTNSNGLGITAKCIKNSLDTGRFSKFDFAHNQSEIMGTMISLKIYDDTEELIPEKPMRIFGLGALYRNRLNEYDIYPDDLPNWGTSQEVLFEDFDFWHKGKIVLQENADSDWLLHVDEIVKGIPYYSDNSRVCLIAGGIDDDAHVDFNGNALTMNPADKESGILLAVAEHRYPIFDLGITQKNEKQTIKEGETMAFKTFETESEYNAAIASAVNSAVTAAIATAKQEAKTELQPTIDKLQTDLQTAQASLAEKDTLITESTEKLKSAEASVVSEKTRADAAETKLQEQATAQLISERKQILASIGYPEDLVTKKVDYLGKASKEDFDGFVDEVKVLFASASKTLQAKAEQLGITKEAFASINLTGEDNSGSDTKDEIKTEKKLTMF
jgi:cell wall-associated NlpC family hydrolase